MKRSPQRHEGHKGKTLACCLALCGLLCFGVELEAAVQATETSRETNSLEPRLRWGLLEALQRRAGFTRSHRGPFAAPAEGNSTDSSAMASGWHAGDRVYFAWHQQKDDIICAAFGLRGEVLAAPRIIGKGRWPRLAADGKRVAAAWSHSNDFIVRLYDGKQWGEQIPLNGREASLALAPNGPLYAATSTGLWKLAGNHFERVEQKAYSQPAVAIDPQGRPQVAWQRNGRIVYANAEIDPGERPSLTFAPDGTVHLAYLSKGVLVLRSEKQGSQPARETIQAKNPSWPAVAMGTDGVRLTYLGGAEHGPQALWLVRRAEKEPVLLPSLAGNVTDAWLMLNFGLRYRRSSYRPHDVSISVNDVPIHRFEKTVPDGRFLFRLKPYQVFTSSGGPAPNRVALSSRHMNGGHYATNSDYRIIVRTSWNERYAFGSSEEEVLRSTQSARLNHNQPDLAVLANGLDLPVEAPKPGRIELAVTIANLGEAPSRPARVAMLDNQKMLAEAPLPSLRPDEQQTVTLPLDYDGRLGSVTFRIHQDPPDFDPRDDVLTLMLWGTEARAMAAGTGVGSGVAGAGAAGGKGGSLVVSGLGQYYYSVFDSAGTRKLVDAKTNGEVELPPGSYRVSLNNSSQVTNIQAGRKTVVPAGSVLISGTGQYYYSVLDAAGTRKLADAKTNGEIELLPGTYRVSLNNSSQETSIQAGRKTVVPAGRVTVSGTGQYYYSVLDAAGTKKLADTKTNGEIELLPGSYRVSLNNSSQETSIQAGRKTVVPAGSVAVSGTGQNYYSVHDAAGTKRLADAKTNQEIELLPGSYIVKVNNRQFPAQIRAGQKTAISPQ
jgi:hypothetical protein